MNIHRDYVNIGLSILISSMPSNSFDEVKKNHKAFIKIHRLGLKTEGYLNQGYLGFKQV